VDVFFDTAATALVTSGCSLGILVNRDGERFVDERRLLGVEAQGNLDERSLAGEEQTCRSK
jgi:succinate dehydrogenase/fumarate reductase flavoprotein subunit